MKLSPSLSLYTAFLTLTAVTACRSSRVSQTDTTPTATWQQQPLTVDGSDQDWTKPLPGHSKSENLDYEIANDGQNLYVLISTKDPLEMQKMIQGGMTVWVNGKADKSQSDAVGIGYPLDARNDRDRTLMEEAQPDRYKRPKPMTLEDKKDYALYGFGKASEVASDPQFWTGVLVVPTDEILLSGSVLRETADNGTVLKLDKPIDEYKAKLDDYTTRVQLLDFVV